MLSDSGIVIVDVNIDKETRNIINKPNVVTKGFIYVKENIDIIKEAENIVSEVVKENVKENREDKKVPSIKSEVNYSMSVLNSLMTKDKKIVNFLGTSKNGTSFLVNNLAAPVESFFENTIAVGPVNSLSNSLCPTLFAALETIVFL
jgi:hypothetical protein